VSAALPVSMVAKPWGVDMLPPPFIAPAGERIGEVWFAPPPELPGLLVKYIFTSEKLSVQVHPSDDQALAAGLGRAGKEECWLVIAAEPGATLGVGFAEPLSAEAMRAAALDGSIEELLVWHPVLPGDFFYIPAGTVHAIGAGVSLIEVQQTSDITYRLYDYGRPRELHLDAGLAVAKGEAHPIGLRRKLAERSAEVLVEGPLFRLDRIEGEPAAAVTARYDGKPLLAIPLNGLVSVAGKVVAPGECALVRNIADLAVPHGTLCLIAQDCA
jgi:mannose-6-phosphate isomerase